MKKGGGFVLRSKSNKILIGRPYGTEDFWSLPKGECDKKETTLKAAIREVKEETGFKLPKKEYPEIGKSQYVHNRKEITFYTARDLKEFKPVCKSMIPGSNLPEIEEFKWVSPLEARKLLHYSQKHLISYK